MLGETVTHYKIEGQLGEGGMGVVYLATDLSLDRKVAIKFAGQAEAGPGDGVGLTAEARAASRLNHPNIAQIYDFGETDEGEPFFVMEYVPGKNLSELLEEGPLGLDRSLAIVRAAAAALGEAHRHGVIHRDIKPGNIRITEAGVTKVLDFGLAKTSPAASADPDATRNLSVSGLPGAIHGTPGYLSPEQAFGRRVDARSDLFSLGCVLYECLTGRRPFPARDLLEALALVHTEHPPPPSAFDPTIPRHVDRVVARLMEKEPAARFQSAEELLTALDVREPRLALLRRRGVLWASLTSAVALGVAAVWLIFPRAYQPSPQAAHWYEEGLNDIRDGTYLKASKALSEAVRLEPNFVLARAHLAESWLELDYADRAREEVLRIHRLGRFTSGLPKVDQLHVDAIDYLVTGDPQEAIARYRQMLRYYDGPQRAPVYLDLGHAYEWASDSKNALACYLEAERSDNQCAAAFLRQGLLLRRAHRYAEAASAFDSAQRLYKAASNLEGGTEVAYGQGILLIDQERPAEAQKTLQEALATARLALNSQQQVKILLQLATLRVRSGELEEVRSLAQEAVDIARGDGVENLASRALLSLGSAYFLKDKVEAERYYQQALEAARRNRAATTEAKARLALGSLYSSRGAPDRSVAQLQPAADYFRRAGFQSDALQASILLGRARRDLGDLDGAEKVFQDLLAQVDKSGSNGDRALLHEAVGNILLLKERYRAAAEEYNTAYQFNVAAQNRTATAYTLLGRAQPLWRLGDFVAARRLLDEVESTAKALQINDLQASVRRERAQMALSQNQPAQATSALNGLDQSRLSRQNEAEVASLKALAFARSGRAREGVRLCTDAVAAADALRAQSLVVQCALSCAETALMANNPSQAQAWAGQARAAAQRSGLGDSEWRASAVIGLAGGKEAVASARAALARLQKEWAPEDFQRYLSRPDVKRLSNQLSRLEGKP